MDDRDVGDAVIQRGLPGGQIRHRTAVGEKNKIGTIRAEQGLRVGSVFQCATELFARVVVQPLMTDPCRLLFADQRVLAPSLDAGDPVTLFGQCEQDVVIPLGDTAELRIIRVKQDVLGQTEGLQGKAEAVSERLAGRLRKRDPGGRRGPVLSRSRGLHVPGQPCRRPVLVPPT
jgi:hypothetical protein